MPVRVFHVGYLQAVLWQPLDDARKTQASQWCRVSLHRAGERLVVKPETSTLIAPPELPQAIEALREAQAFLDRSTASTCAQGS